MARIALGGYFIRMGTSMNAWTPPKSPHGLIQEQLWPDEWKTLVSCLLLNQTTRKQLDKVIEEFFTRWPTPQKLLESSAEEIGSVLKPLGFWRRRPKTLLKFSKEYIEKDWKEPIELHGCGKYANDAWHIFIVGDWKVIQPQDHALNAYHDWLKERNEIN